MHMPDGEGVISSKAPAGKVIAFYAGLLGLGAALTVSILAALGFLAIGGEAKAARREPATLEEKVDSIGDRLTRMEIDIGIIKRQLGLDGLGAPPPPAVRATRIVP